MRSIYAALLSLVVTNDYSAAFAPSLGMAKTHTKKMKPLFLEKGEDDGDYRSNMDIMRRMLEESWNGDTMGAFIPTSAESAASAAAESIFSALGDSVHSEEGKVFMVDIGLPSFDPLSGPNVYDDISAVEFCTELANRINDQRNNCDLLRKEGRCAIIVKDGNLASRSNRLLTSEPEDDVVEFDDFADLGMSSEMIQSPQNVNTYRIGSFTGNEGSTISTGPKMMQEIATLVASNAMPAAETKNEDVIIISCPTMNQAELVGVRLIVSQYSSSKTIVIVNNRLDPLPTELITSETVYSVLPLIARSVKGNSDNPKIVLLRRYPRNWEVHLDSKGDAGFQLVSSVPAETVGLRGPSMEWIGERVKSYMETKFNA